MIPNLCFEYVSTLQRYDYFPEYPRISEIFIRLCQILRVFPHTASIMLYGNLPTRETNKCQSLYKQGALLQLPKGCGSEAGCHIHVLVQGKSKYLSP